MTDSNAMFTPADMRRAYALYAHRADHYWPGVRAVLAEADAAGAGLCLAAAAVDVFFQMVPGADSPEGAEALRQVAQSWAVEEANAAQAGAEADGESTP